MNKKSTLRSVANDYLTHPKSYKGITLIALVITIIIMLILVAVTINLAINGGLFGYAGKANSEKIIADEKEQIGLAYYNAKMGKLGQEVDDTDMQTAMDAQIGANKAEVTLDDDDNIKIYFIDTQHTYIFDGENVVKKDPLILHITNYNELYDFAVRVNGGEDFEDYIVYLDNDIEMDVEDWIVIGRPGGRETPSYPFKGIFEGNNHTISNIIITTSRTYNGLFCLNLGTIQNLNVEGTLSGSIGINVGLLVGYNNGTVKNCTADVDCNLSIGYSGYSSGVGGLVGLNYGIIDLCITEGEIIVNAADNSSTGGIVGINSNSTSNCKNFADIHSNSRNTGGIAGKNENSGIVERCLNGGNIDNGDTNGSSNSNYKGGIVGENRQSSIRECKNKGDVCTPSTARAYAGGICGNLASGTGEIINCYNAGDVRKLGSAMSATGILACTENGNNNLTIENCYNIGDVINYPIYSTTDKLDGITNCYYDADTNTASSQEKNGTGLTTVEMKSAAFVTMLGNAFKADTNNINDGYPILSWE